MICMNCGKEVADGTRFCTECGAPMQPQQPPMYQQPYQQQYQPYRQENNEAPVSMGQYLLWLILSAIPTAGFIIMIIFALDKTNKNRSNFAKAMLILTAVGVVIVTFFVIIAAIFGSAVGSEVVGELGNEFNMTL